MLVIERRDDDGAIGVRAAHLAEAFAILFTQQSQAFPGQRRTFLMMLLSQREAQRGGVIAQSGAHYDS